MFLNRNITTMNSAMMNRLIVTVVRKETDFSFIIKQKSEGEDLEYIEPMLAENVLLKNYVPAHQEENTLIVGRMSI